MQVMEVKCPHNKLENTILDLNQRGYKVISSEIQEQEYILRIKKIDNHAKNKIFNKDHLSI